MDGAFFTTTDGDWFTPTDVCRGPWDPDACHAGPPTGLLARAAERLRPDQQLVRLTVDLVRPIPHRGFRVAAELVRSGRRVSTTSMVIVDAGDHVVVTASGMLLTPAEPFDVPSVPWAVPSLADAGADRFPIASAGHGLPMFASGVEVRYPPGQTPEPGPTTLWMRSVPLVAGEEPSPFQRLCPLADCGNGISRNADADHVAFLNTDLTLVVHRPPVGEWFGIDAVSRWESNGIGMSDSLLFDEAGPVGRAVQTIVVEPRA